MTTMIEIPSALTHAPVFAGIEPAEVQRILVRFDEQSFNAGHRVTLEGYRGSEFYLISQGRGTVSVGGAPVASLGPGDFFGEMAVLGDGFRSATVTADTPLRCFVLNNNALEQLLVDHPRLGINLLHEVVSRFRSRGGNPPRRMRVLSS